MNGSPAPSGQTLFLWPILASAFCCALCVLWASRVYRRAGDWIDRQLADVERRWASLETGGDPAPELSKGDPNPARSSPEPSLAAVTLHLKDRIAWGDRDVRGKDVADLFEAHTDGRVLVARRIYPMIVFFGLIGTVMGLQAALVSMGTFGDLKESAQIVPFLKQAKGVLGHFGLAFVATLAGVLGTIAVAALDYAYSKRQQSLSERLVGFVDFQLRPYLQRRYAPFSEEAASSSVVEVLEAMAANLPAAARELRTMTADVMTAVVSLNASSAANEAAATALSGGLGDLAALPSALVSHLDEVRASSRGLAEALAAVSSDVDPLLRQLTDTTMRQSRLADESMKLLDAIARRQAEESKQAQLLTSESSKALAKAGEAVAMVGRLEEGLAALGPVLERQGGVVESLAKLDGTLTKLATEMDAGSGVAARLSRMEPKIDALGSRSDGQFVGEAVGGIERTLRTLLAERDAPAPASDRSAAAGTDIRAQVSELSGSILQLKSAVAAWPGKGEDPGELKAELVEMRRVLVGIRNLLTPATERRPWWRPRGR